MNSTLLFERRYDIRERERRERTMQNEAERFTKPIADRIFTKIVLAIGLGNFTGYFTGYNF